ncbi:prevent-host-death family protein [Catenuloplanes nepalensis]|uniref:Prevent-host-death family protein n=1 Tax=Catenuloplanes nepalensis TaxID=587533 RepID=A0ABT9MK52_9ACTN|nr:type II toxin-antitoxin system prevent-host-death family antitoxin [Catenuloplanes nepalensis]MDP9791797.1 prevent-host-death family protein [Catenuloplanes nepalensis]
MEQIPIRVLNQDTAGVLAKVEQGAVIEVTNRGHPIARIVPAKGDPLAGLVEAGVVLPPTVVGPFLMPTAAAEPGADAGELMSGLRDEERW